MEGNFHGTADIVPVDLAINLMIVAACNTAQDKYATQIFELNSVGSVCLNTVVQT